MTKGVDQVIHGMISFLEIEYLILSKEPADKTGMIWT
jgi:hypothetical protein